jgi:hypothetical protein
MNAEMSHDANGLVLEACLTEVVAYGPAEATATGKRINSAETAAAVRGKPFFMPHLHPIATRPLRTSSCDGRRTVKRADLQGVPLHGRIPTLISPATGRTSW